MSTLADRMQYFTLKRRLKEEHDKKIHDLEFKYANIIVQLMREKETIHKELQNRFYSRLDQINQMIFRSISNQSVKQHYSQFNPVNIDKSKKNHNNENHKDKNHKDKNHKDNSDNLNVTSTNVNESIADNKGTPNSMLPITLLQEIKSESVPTHTSQKNNKLINADLISKSPPDSFKTLLTAVNQMESKTNQNISSSSDDDDDEFILPSRYRDKNNMKQESNGSSSPLGDNWKKDCIQVKDGFACRICNKKLARAYDIKRHIRCMYYYSLFSFSSSLLSLFIIIINRCSLR